MMDDDRGRTPPRDEGPVDLAALFGDRRTPERWAALAARIEAAAAPELARRAVLARRGGGLLDGVVNAVARFAAPALVAAAAAIVIAIGASRQGDLPPDAAPVVASAETLSEQTVRQALGDEPDGWLGSRDASDADELVRAMYAGGGQE